MKAKTHSGASKRFKVTGTGKIRFQRAGKRHHLEVKPSTRTRRMNRGGEVSAVDMPRVKKLLGR